MAEIKKNKKQQLLVRMWGQGSPLALLVGMQTGAATVESSMEFPQKVKNGTTLGSSNCTGYFPKTTKALKMIYAPLCLL